MFDLERAIAEWRRNLAAEGINSSVALDELESHLRDEIQQQRRSGLNDPLAFEMAIQSIGKPGALKGEFKKVGGTSTTLEKLMIAIGFVFIVFIVLLGTATVFLCFAGTGDRAMASIAMAGTVLVACGWRQAVPFLPMIASAKKRWAVGLSCVAFGFAASAFYCNVVLPHFGNPDHQIPAIGFWAAFIIAVFSCAGVGLTLSEHEREIRGMNKSRFKTSAPTDS